MAWGFVGNFSCDITATGECPRSANMGWRYTLFTLGSLVLVLAMVRFFIFRMPESPYFLLSKGRDQDAIDVVHHIAKKSKKSVDISIERFQNIDEAYGNERPPAATIGSVGTFFSAFKGQFANLGANSIKLLFGTRKMALQTSLIIWIWASVGLAYPLYSTFLPYYLAERTKQISSASTNAEIYGSYCYIAACTIPGPIIAGYLIDWKTLGRRYTMAIATLLSGVFLYLSTTAKTTAAVTGWNCTVTIVINLFFAIQVRVLWQRKGI